MIPGDRAHPLHPVREHRRRALPRGLPALQRRTPHARALRRRRSLVHERGCGWQRGRGGCCVAAGLPGPDAAAHTVPRDEEVERHQRLRGDAEALQVPASPALSTTRVQPRGVWCLEIRILRNKQKDV